MTLATFDPPYAPVDDLGQQVRLCLAEILAVPLNVIPRLDGAMALDCIRAMRGFVAQLGFALLPAMAERCFAPIELLCDEAAMVGVTSFELLAFVRRRATADDLGTPGAVIIRLTLQREQFAAPPFEHRRFYGDWHWEAVYEPTGLASNNLVFRTSYHPPGALVTHLCQLSLLSAVKARGLQVLQGGGVDAVVTIPSAAVGARALAGAKPDGGVS